MNDAAQPSSRMVSKINSAFVKRGPQQPDSAAMPSTPPPASSLPTATSPPTANPPAAHDNDSFSDSQKLALFDQIISQVERQQIPADPTPTQSAPLSPPPSPPTSLNVGGKEAVEIASSPDQAQLDAAAAIQYVEKEKNPEIPVEVEGFLKSVEDMADEQPPEIFIADGTTEQPQANYPSRPVVVLPITQKIEEQGARKSPKLSIRWLVEWSRKIMKVFAGKVIYREEQPTAAS